MTAADGPEGLVAAVLVGGQGRRLRPAVPDRPKALAPVAGRPAVSYILEQLQHGGVAEAVLCTGDRGAMITQALGVKYGTVNLRYSQELSPLGTAGALRLARPLLTSEPVLALNGDSLCRLDLRAFLAWHRASGAAATLALARQSDTTRYGAVDLAENGMVRRFVEKSAAGGPGWVSAGVYLLSQAFLASIGAGRPVSLEREVFPAWVGRGLAAWTGAEALLDIGVPEAYAQAGAHVQRLTGASGP